MKRYGVFNRGLRRLSLLGEFLGAEVVPVIGMTPPGLDATLGWGRRKYARRARQVAASSGIPFLALEDGFLRSVALGSQEPPLSLVVDDLGIYYDATSPSRLEALIDAPIDATAQQRTQALINAWRSSRVSKYNHQREYAGELPAHYVLVVDQTYGDAAIQYGLASAESFQHMLQAALQENPDCTVVVKIHPDVFAGRRKGHFDVSALMAMPRVQVLANDVHPVRLLENAQTVYCVTSQMGFEALLWGKPVRTFGMPFYAGWGLTQDELPSPLRRGKATLLQLVYAALVDYPRYIHPETGVRCQVEDLLAWMGLQRQMRERFPAEVYAFGFSRWKKPIVQDYLQGSRVHFVQSLAEVPAGGMLVVWGRRELGEAADRLRLIRLEDGFLRSVGLGADLIRPVSWVLDDVGIYFDATQPSRLEHWLQTAVFDEPLRARAASLREAIVARGFTKYNVGAGTWPRPAEAQRVILVPGQVESDASLAWGAPGIRRNVELLQAVRQANPDAYIVYKPHPDVVAGLRRDGHAGENLAVWCDEQVINVPMAALLDQVDEVHTLTSLAGFEALLRGKKVVCHGLPFYAGWGLTTDMLPPPAGRRGRVLALEELVAGAMLLYPCYLSRRTGRFTTAEGTLDELLTWQRTGASRMPLWRRLLRTVLGAWAHWRER